MTSIGEYFESVRIRGIDEGSGPEVVQSYTATPADGSLELPTGPAGPAGAVGPAGHSWRWEGDVADGAALQALASTLRPVHAGKAWRVLSTNALMVWTGTTFDTYEHAFGAHGPVGAVNELTLGTVTTGAAGTDVIVAVTGDSPGQTIEITLPRGVQGATGPLNVHVLEGERSGLITYALVYGDETVARPLWFQLRVAPELLLRGRRPLTLVMARHEGHVPGDREDGVTGGPAVALVRTMVDTLLRRSSE